MLIHGPCDVCNRFFCVVDSPLRANYEDICLSYRVVPSGSFPEFLFAGAKEKQRKFIFQKIEENRNAAST